MQRVGSRQRQTVRAGFSLLELAIASLIIGIVMVGALKTLGASRRSSVSISRAITAAQLLDDLSQEISQLPYEEPFETIAFGPEASEPGPSRVLFDDIDDYRNWSESPPQRQDGSILLDDSQWQRTVSVEYVTRSDPNVTTSIPDGVNRVVVSVFYNGRLMGTRMLTMTKSRQLPPYE